MNGLQTAHLEFFAVYSFRWLVARSLAVSLAVKSSFRDSEIVSRRVSNRKRDSHGVRFSLGIARDGVGNAGIVCQQAR